MAKDVTPKDIQFEPLEPGMRLPTGRDFIRVTEYGLTLSAKATAHLKGATTMAVQVSSDGRAIKLSSPGPFRVSIKSHADSKYNTTPTLQINSVAIPQRATIGVYLNQGNLTYRLEDE